MYIRNKRKSRPAGNFSESRRGILVGNGKTYEVAPRFAQGLYLSDAPLDVDSLAVQHRLYGYGRAASYCDFAYVYAPGKAPFNLFCGRIHFFLASALYSSDFFFISAACGNACDE